MTFGHSIIAAMLACTFACGQSTPPPRDATSAASANDYPGVLHLASELSPDFLVQQHVDVTAMHDGEQHQGSFDAVVQKKGGDLTMIGLGPMGIRAFVLKQVGDTADFQQSMGPKLPFPPRNILIDVHRAYFVRLPVGETHGTRRGTIDGEDITEVWDGELRERRFVRSDRPGAVRVVYGPGCTDAHCAPETVQLINEWYGYTLAIKNESYTFF